MRCLALAETWRRLGGEAVMLGQIEAQNVQQRMQRAGIVYAPLGCHEDYGTALAQSQQMLLTMRDSARDQAHRPWFVLDGYRFDADYQHTVRGQGYKLCVVDDNAHLDVYDADILLNQNVGNQDIVCQIPDEIAYASVDHPM
ncbi:MAG: hypothetical protein R2856_33640 [Caldilineaceae bacterium]